MSSELLQRWKDIDTTLPSLLPLQAPPQEPDPGKILSYVQTMHNYMAGDRQALVRAINVLARFRNIQTDNKTDADAKATASGTLKVQTDTAIAYFDAFGQEAGSGAEWKPLIPAYTQDTLDPTGFVNTNTDSTLAIVGGALTITPTATSYSFYIKGKKFTKTSDSVSLAAATTEGNWFVYYNSSGTLVLDDSVTAEDIIRNNCFVAELYHDGTNVVFWMDERHGLMPWQTHLWIHQNEGTVLGSGLGLGNITADGNGNNDVHAEFSASGGVIKDEDLSHTIAAVTTNWVGMYLDTGVWVMQDTSSSSPVQLDAGVPQYNDISVPGSESLVNVANNDFFLMHVFATNIVMDANGVTLGGYVAMVGQAEYPTKTKAREGANDEIASLVTQSLPMPEFLPVGTVILQRKGSNAYNCRVVSTDTGDDYVSWLGASIQPGTPPASHKNLTDRDAVAQHPLSAIQGGSTYPFPDDMHFSATSAPAILNETPTSTNPTLVPHGGDVDTGIGWPGADALSLICSGAEVARITTASINSLQSIFIDKAASPALQLRPAATAADRLVLSKDAGGTAFLGNYAASGQALTRIDAVPSDGTSSALIQINRTTNTTGSAEVVIYKGNGTGTINFRFYNSGNCTLDAQAAGTVTIGNILDVNGRVRLPYLSAAPSTLVNGDMWMESDGLHIYYAGAEKTVAGV